MINYYLTKNTTKTCKFHTYLWKGTEPPRQEGNIWIGSKNCKVLGYFDDTILDTLKIVNLNK